MSYSNVDNIREEAGFKGNANVTDAKITTFMDAATSHIDGRLAKVYSLPLEETPDSLELIERRLAAGFLLLEEYGEQAEGTDKDGNSKINWANSELDKLVSGETQLIGDDDESLATSDSVRMKGWPTPSTGTDKTTQGEKDDPPVFEVGEEF